MKSYFAVLVLLILVVDAVKALKCHQCEYLEGKTLKDSEMGVRFDKSCKSGKKPNKKFVLECPMISNVCLKIVAEGRNEDKDIIKYTIRSCGIRGHFPGYKNDKCEDQNSTILRGLVGNKLSDTLEGTVCLCSDDKCNSSSMLKVTQHFILMALGVLCYKFITIY